MLAAMAPATKKKPKPAAKEPAAKKPTARKPAAKKAKQPSKPAKVPIAVVRGLATALEREGDAWQVCGLAEQLGKLGDSRAAAASPPALAHTPKGNAVARAYLEALAADDPAD